MKEKESRIAEVEISIQETMDICEKVFIQHPELPPETILNNTVIFLGMREINKKILLKESSDGLTFKKDFWFREP